MFFLLTGFENIELNIYLLEIIQFKMTPLYCLMYCIGLRFYNKVLWRTSMIYNFTWGYHETHRINRWYALGKYSSLL